METKKLTELEKIFQEKRDFKDLVIDNESKSTWVELRHQSSNFGSSYCGHLGMQFRTKQPVSVDYSHNRLYFASREAEFHLNLDVADTDMERANYGDIGTGRNRIRMPLSRNGLEEFELTLTVEG